MSLRVLIRSLNSLLGIYCDRQEGTYCGNLPRVNITVVQHPVLFNPCTFSYSADESSLGYLFAAVGTLEVQLGVGGALRYAVRRLLSILMYDSQKCLSCTRFVT
jgi:hypothetical protein